MSRDAQQRPLEPAAPLSMRAIVLGGALMVLVGVTAFLTVLFFYGGGTDQDQVRLDAVRTAGTLVVGVGGLFALLLAARRQRSTELTLEQQRLTLENQRATLEHQREAAASTARDAVEQRITELYAHAVDQLGNNQAPVRLGGLHALERLAQNNPTQRQTIVDVICAYLRMPYTPPGDKPSEVDTLPEVRTQYEHRRQELQVRLTAQRILAAHLSPENEEIFWPGMDLDLAEAQLHRFDLTCCHIKNAQFSGAQFSEDAEFSEVQFFGDAEFSQAQFFGNAWFNRAQFSGYAEFSKAQFSKDAWFNEAQFSKDASFNKAQFSRNARFSEAQFSENAEFSEAQFSEDAEFSEAQFSENAEFSEAQFSKDAWFNEAQFSRNAGFSKAQFSGVVEFAGARLAKRGRHLSPAGWITHEVNREGQSDWLYLVRPE